LKVFYKESSLDDRWLKASVIGSTWGSFEIITGSFLHNLKIPFAGTIMAFFSILLMTAFLQQWKQKGLIWRAGLIAALMKSLSPSAFLLGPMTGIFIEALFMELTISLLGINFFSCVIGGALSLLSALMHKLINLIIIYGKDFITIYENIVSFAFKQFHDAGITIAHFLGGLALVYIFAGMLAAVLGFIAGRGITNSISSTIPENQLYKPQTRSSLAAKTDRSVLLLVSHLIAIPLLIYLNYKLDWYFSLIAVFLYIIMLIIIYPVVFKRLSKPALWLQIGFMLLLSILFLGSYNSYTGFNSHGLISGVRMNLRAVLVIAGFAAIGFELRNEKIKNLLISILHPGIYQSISISFNLLPGIMQYMDSPGRIIRHPFRTLKLMLANADVAFRQLENEHSNDNTQ
jgi:hypothetical protein